MNKKVLLAVIGITIFITIIIVVAIAAHPANTYKGPGHPVGLEKGSNSLGQVTGVGLENGQQLQNHLLSTQYQAVHQAIGTFVTDRISNSIVSVSVVTGSVVLHQDGSINFSVQVNKPKETIGIFLQFPSAEEIIFSIPSANYTQNLYPYGSSTSSTAGSLTDSTTSNTVE